MVYHRQWAVVRLVLSWGLSPIAAGGCGGLIGNPHVPESDSGKGIWGHEQLKSGMGPVPPEDEVLGSRVPTQVSHLSDEPGIPT
jgi:hypothetical protein